METISENEFSELYQMSPPDTRSADTVSACAFYEDCVDRLATITTHPTLPDIDWDDVRRRCKGMKTYSASAFIKIVARQFGVTVDEMMDELQNPRWA